MKKSKIALALTGMLLMPSAFAITAFIENPDHVRIQIADGESNGQESTYYYKSKPSENPSKLIIDNGNIYNGTVLNVGYDGKTECNYAIISGINKGFKMQSSGEGCTNSFSNYKPMNSPVVTIINNSSEVIHGLFTINDGVISTSKLPDMTPNQAELYSGDSGIWKEHNVKFGDKVKMSAFVKSLSYEVSCPTIENLTENKVFIIEGDGWKTSCRLESFTKGIVSKDNQSKLEANVAAERGFIVKYKVPEDASTDSYYVVVLDKARTKYASYVKVKPGTEGDISAKVIQSWFPNGGDFIIGLAKEASAPNSVALIGDTIEVSTYALMD
ncbi:hypothetical protein [Pantoea phytobeneficialis]|uniref:Uncharacterized protein n=1 Tax=Pantoea phytobeneficialis TaxID=2052056 RepID=A0AAP9KN48_9GAMM|nr:hypothetical protein [Pantoea phytobeneficialis]MDO6407781.1 hypothetical protein [Pantoea phytobeneficialis]QGR05546.1 hypothetical protein CTZ24_03640 [Pantoea phytobeneficialis]